ncbi:bifunctional UDP-sugar hydrolase/5'-nucleotidase [Facklamia sp. 7083-14-GEN3]|uniref:bifunctional metallophosphatase/5'-nucleotidase n=1 Tax=Facklamia sp. 7083-14-GEN3 TaxID=2973478 RepID=UPI00215C539B|nr:metallophosphoesterase [Facklamia sp. 7083-14-GEN3]MCR8969111.1 5'-nucleotidase C-terminal domain-containing protein [Facklamia sp. 7083-14-GEN3]
MFTLYHTNDLHSEFEYLGKVFAYLKKHRQADDLYFDAGDLLDLKDSLVSADGGYLTLDLVSQFGLDLLALGNNEIDLGFEGIQSLLDQQFPLICANIHDNSGQTLRGLPNKRVLTRQGCRLLVIGLAPYYGQGMRADSYNGFFKLGNLMTGDPFRALEDLFREEEGNYDVCVLLSHSGLEVDQEFLARYPQIDLILGGHSHDFVITDRYSQVGFMGQGLGRIQIDKVDGIWQIIAMDHINLEENYDQDFMEDLEKKRQQAEEMMSLPLKCVSNLSFDPYQECPLINFICDCLLDAFPGDLAIMHHGIAEGPLTLPVSRKSLLELFPSKLNPTYYKLKGSAIIEAYNLSLNQNHISQEGRGPGFRGHVLGTLAFSHNVLISDGELFLNGELVDPDKEYSIVTDDYLQRGTGYRSLAVPDDVCNYHKWFIRDLVKNYLDRQDIFIQAHKSRTMNCDLKIDVEGE